MADLQKNNARKRLAHGRVWLTKNTLNGAGTIAVRDNETDATFTINLAPNEVAEIAAFFAPESEGLMTEKLSERVERLEGPDREVDREIADALGLGPDETWERPVSRKGVASMNTGDWIKGNLLRRSKHYTASLDAAMSLLNEHGCDLHIRPSATTVRCFPNEDEGVKATAKTPAIALCAAALKARGL